MPEDPLSWHAGWLMIVLGLVVAAAGLWLLIGPPIGWLGRLPGDIRVEGERFRFYFPLATCLLLSIVLSFVLWLVNRLMR